MNQSKKVLLLQTEDNYILSHRITLAHYFQEQGYEVVIACDNTGKIDKIRNYGFRVIDLQYKPTNKLADLKLLFKLRRLIKAEKPNVIHNVNLRMVFVGMLSLKSIIGNNSIGSINAIMGLGYLFTHHSIKTKAIRFVVMRLLKWAFKQNNARVIVQNGDDYRTLTTHMVFESKTVLIKGSGVDLSQYKQRSYTGKLPGQFNVGMMSRLIESKGVKEFFEAAKILYEQNNIHIRFHLYGEPVLSNPLSLSHNTLQQWNDELSNFQWHGHVGNMVEVYQQTEVAVLPSYYGEGVPKCLIEAAACGLPLITTDMPGCREICKHRVNGLLVPIKDAQSLVEAVLYFINNPEKLTTMGQASRQLVEQEFTDDMVNKQTWQVYQSIFNGTAVNQ